jgi:hypothetical protein
MSEVHGKTRNMIQSVYIYGYDISSLTKTIHQALELFINCMCLPKVHKFGLRSYAQDKKTTLDGSLTEHQACQGERLEEAST